MKKWNYELRVIVFRAFKFEFGEHKSFTGFYCPRGKAQALDKLLGELQTTLRQVGGVEFSKQAIMQQVAFAVTNQKDFNNKGHIRNWILNTVAAMEAGYITTSHLPSKLICRS